MTDLHLIGNAHLDPVWLWPWQEGYAEVLATFASALERLKEFPDMKFTAAGAVYYRWVQETAPEMFEQIREMVAQGRWEIVGGWYLQPDCNMPDGESFLRHGLISQRYYKENFGITAKIGYNVDSFGHNAGLPKILNASGMESYVFMRPSVAEQGRSEHLFRWESDDGSHVTAFRIPHYYNIVESRLHLLEDIRQLSLRDGLPYMAFYGVGNHGGGPTIQLLDAINRLPIEGMAYSTTEAYFRQVQGRELPVLTGDLQHHARGCYSACTFVKSENRRCEQNLLAAEKFCAMAAALTGAAYPAQELKTAWENLLFNQFHDVLGGCSIKPAYTDAAHRFGMTMGITEQLINSALQKIAWRIDTLQGQTLPAYKTNGVSVWQHEVLGTPLVVFNANPWPVTAPVSVYAEATCVTDSQGNEIPFQTVRGPQTNSAERYHTAFNAEVPALGYAVYRMFREKPSAASFTSPLQVTQTSLENECIRVELDPVTGDISRFYDKATGENVIASPCSAVLLDETHCDTWAHDEASLGQTVGQFRAKDFRVVEDGCVIASVRVTSEYGASTLVRTYSITPGSTAVTVDTTVDFHEKHRALKFAFPITGDAVTAKTAFGTITKPLGTGEEPCGAWIACGKLCIANDGKYGYDTENGQLRMSVLRGAVYADHFGQSYRDDISEYMDQGFHSFRYRVLPFESKSACERSAAELNCGLRLIAGSFHRGDLPETMCCLECDSPNVVVSAIKQQEDGNGNILRFYELEGKDTPVTLKLFGKPLQAHISHHALMTLRSDGVPLNAIEWEIKE